MPGALRSVRVVVCDSPGSAGEQLEPDGAAETGLAQRGRVGHSTVWHSTVWHSMVWHGCAAQRWETTAFLFLGLSTTSSGCRILLFKSTGIFVNTDKVGTIVHIRVNKSKRDTGVGFFSLILANSKVKLCSVCDYAIQSGSSAQIFLQGVWCKNLFVSLCFLGAAELVGFNAVCLEYKLQPPEFSQRQVLYSFLLHE